MRNWINHCISFCLVVISTSSLFAQVSWIEQKKVEFQASKNDSLFIVKNSESPYRRVFLTRGDEPEDVEVAIYSAKVGQVVGPFHTVTHDFLFRVIKLDSSRNHWFVNHIFIKPKGASKEDTLAALTLAKKLAKDLNKGSEFSELYKTGDDFKVYAQKEHLGKMPGVDGPTGWIWEGTTVPEFDLALLKVKKGESVVVKSRIGIHVFQVTEKEVGFYKAVVIPLLKKVTR